MSLKCVLRSVLALAVACCASFASAGEVTVAGHATGKLGELSPLMFRGKSFAVTTSGGLAPLTGLNNLGSFTLPDGAYLSMPGIFTLSVTFTSPIGNAGGEPVTRTFTGLVSANRQGGVCVRFTRPVTRLTLDGDGVNGLYSISLLGVSVKPGQTVPLSAVLTHLQGSSAACSLEYLGVQANPWVLKAVNNEMTPVVVSATSDHGRCAPSCKIESVTSNEPAGPSGDWQITGGLAVKLRARRPNAAAERVYTIAVQCADASGNTAEQDTHVLVPGASDANNQDDL